MKNFDYFTRQGYDVLRSYKDGKVEAYSLYYKGEFVDIFSTYKELCLAAIFHNDEQTIKIL